MTRSKDTASQRLLDAWSPPQGSGDPIGCIATSFTFNAVLFEEECLSRFLALETHPEDDGAIYLIEREEKLASVVCAAALVDARHCRGARSLRWDLLPARVPSKRALHSKIALLCWQNRVRLIIGSANLTDDGYRRNQENFGVLDFGPAGPMSTDALVSVTQFLDELVTFASGPAVTRWRALTARATALAKAWTGPRAAVPVRIAPVLVGPGRPDAISQLTTLWPDNSPPHTAHVLSPFFDQGASSSKTAAALWRALRQRGAASVTFHVKAGPGADGATVVVAAPGGLRDAKPKSRSEVEIRFAQVQESDVPTDAGPAVRPLHAKSLWLENDKWICHTVGSSNFTGAGLGLADAPNVEANLAYFVARDRDPGLARRLEQVWPMHEYLDDSTLAFAPEPDETEGTEAQILPDFFQSATLRAVRPGELSLDLQFSPSAKPPPKWVIFVEGEKVPLLDEAAWIKKGQPTTASLAWPADLRPPTGLEVSLEEAAGRAWWPVNVWDFSALPPPEELRSLTLDALIDILTSAKPLREAMREWLRRRARAAMSGSSNAQVPELDPLRRVDTSAFVLQRTRRISWALRGLRDRLERPAATEDALNWRLGGPVGASAVARAIERECGPRSADEHAFALAELVLELIRVRPADAPGCLSAAEVREHVRAFARELAPAAKAAAINASPPTRKYVEGALTELA